MPRDPVKDTMDKPSLPGDPRAVSEDDLRHLMAQVSTGLAPLIDQYGEGSIDVILTPIIRIAECDRQAAFMILQECPDIAGRLHSIGGKAVLDVFDMANEMIPFGPLLAMRFLEISPSLLGEADFETLIKTAALACSIAPVNIRTAISVIEQSPVIIRRAGFEGLRRVASFAASVAHSSQTYSIKAVEESPARIDRIIEAAPDSDTPLAVYHLASLMARDDWNTAMDFVAKVPDLIKALPLSGQKALIEYLFDRAEKAIPFGSRMVLVFMETAPALIGRLGSEGARTVWQCALAMAAGNPDYAISLLNKSPGIVEHLQSRLQRSQIEQIYHLGIRLSKVSPQVALKWVDASVEMTRRLDDNAMQRIADMAEQTAQESHMLAVTFLDVAAGILDKSSMDGLQEVQNLSADIARQSLEAASRFLSKSPDLIDRIGIGGLKMIGNFSSSLARESWSAAVQILDKCPSILDGLLSIGDASLIAKVCHLGSRIVKHNGRMAISFLNRSPDIIKLIGIDGLEQIEDLAYETGKASWTAAVSLLEAGPQIIERVGFDGLKQIAALAQMVACQNSYGAVSLLEKSPDLIDRLLPHGGPPLALRVYTLAGIAAGSDWMLASTLLEKSVMILGKIGLEGLEKLFALINTTARQSGKIASRFLDVSPAVIEKTGFEGLEILVECALAVGQKDVQAAADIVTNSPQLLDRLHHTSEKTVAPMVYKLTAMVAQTSVRAAVRLIDKSPEYINWVGLEGFGMIASFIEAAAKEDEEKALSFLTGNSPAFSDFMESIPKGLELKTIRHVLSSYLRALLGRRVEITEAEIIDTDGKKIYLPGRIKDFQDQEDNFRIYKVYATHQEAHLEYGSYEFDIHRMKESAGHIESRYGKKTESEDLSDIDRFVHLFPEPDLARDLFNLLEDFRIEGILKREYPALGIDIAQVNQHMVRKRRPPAKMINPKQRAMEMITQFLMAGKTFSDVKDPSILILRKTIDWSESLLKPASDVHDAARLASAVYMMLDDAFKEPYRPVKPASKPLDQNMISQNIGSFGKTSQQIRQRLHDRHRASQRNPSGPRVEAQNSAEGDVSPAQTRPDSENITERPQQAGQKQRSFRGAPGSGKQPASHEKDQTEDADGMDASMNFDSAEKIERLLRSLYREKGITPKEIERQLELSSANDVYLFLRSLEVSLEKKAELQSEPGTSLYDEWGEDLHDYRSNWARIREQTHAGTSLDFYRDTTERHAGLLKKIRREFQMLKPEGFAKLKRQYEGDDIDLDAVVEFLVDRKAGISPSEKNYTLIQKRRRDIAVAFLIDMSRSTKGATIAREKESLIIMSEALHEVGDAFAIYGFSGDNRDNVDYYRIKDFDDAYDDITKKRISAIEDRFENRDGTAIRHTISKLRRRQERTKLIVLLSDGKPIDKEYAGTYAIEDTRMALKEAQHFGIRTFCITVDRTAAEYLPRMYSHSSWTVIDDVVKLPEKITRIYRMLTA